MSKYEIKQTFKNSYTEKQLWRMLTEYETLPQNQECIFGYTVGEIMDCIHTVIGWYRGYVA